jgi:predicted acyltransferase (DUF342 family)
MPMPAQQKIGRVGCRGGVLFVVVGALIVLSIVGAVVSRLTGSSSWTEIQENRFGSSYYAALSGFEYLKYAETNPDDVYVDVNDFIKQINDGSPYTLPSGRGQFEIVLASVSGSTTAYTLSSLIGRSVVGSSSGHDSNFLWAPLGQRAFSAASTTEPKGWLKYVQIGENVSTSSAMSTKGNILATNNLSLVENNIVDGDVVVYQNMTTGSGVQIKGSVYVGGNLVVGPNSTIIKDISVIGNVTIGSGSKVSNITSNGNVVLQSSGQTVAGSINAQGNITISSGSVVDGDLIADGNVVLDPSGCVVKGNIYAGGNVTISSGSRVDKKVVAGGNVVIADSSAEVKGGVNSGGNISVGSSFKTAGGLTASGNVDVKGNVSIGTDINSGGDVSITGASTVVSGSVYVKRNLSISQKSTVSGNASVSGNISLSKGACIAGKTYVAGTVTSCTGATCGAGNCYVSLGGTYAAPLSPETPESPTAVVVREKELAPTHEPNTNSKDGNLSVPNGGTKVFTSGTYYYKYISTEYGSKIKFDLSGGDITIFATKEVKLENSTKIFVSVDGNTYLPMASVDPKLAAKIYLESNSNIELMWAADWFGTLFSRGNISFGGGNTIIGMYASLDGNVSSTSGSNATVTYVPSNYALREWYKD